MNAFGDFIPSTGWVGVYEGYYFGSGAKGVGYYKQADYKQAAAAVAEEQRRQQANGDVP
eukprot:COSAG05_NODE_682_length_7957_cov_277.290405_5_plen_59_part_00